MNKLTLYDISAEGAFIQACLLDTEGELTPEIEERLNALMIAGPDKISAAGHVMANLEQAAAACKMEAERLRERSKSFEAAIDKLRQRMTTALDLAFNGRLQTDTATYWTQKAADSYAIELAAEVSLAQLKAERPDFVRTKLELDKTAIQAAYKAEEPLPDSIFVNHQSGKRYLRWK